MSALENQVAVVTGASSGIGQAIALALASEGARLWLIGRNPQTLRAVADAAAGGASRHRCYVADLAVEREVEALAADIKRESQPVDILVHSAGVIRLGPVEAAPAEQLDWHYRLNLRAPYVLTQGLMPALKVRRGQVVFVNSSAGLAAKANAGQYAATKHALKAVADSLREEVNQAGVRVLNVFLGRTATPLQAALYAAEGTAYRPELLMQPQDVAGMVLHALTLPRTAEVTEISMRPGLKSY